MLKAKDIMTKDVISLKENDDIKSASDIFLKKNINAIPVIGEGKKIKGIVSETDLVVQDSNLHIPTVFTIFDSIFYLGSSKHFKEDVKKITATKIGDIMTKDVYTVSEDEDVFNIATAMSSKKIYSIPVVNKDSEITGIITRYDIIKSMARIR